MVVPAPVTVPLVLMVVPGGGPVAVKVSAAAVLESTAVIGNDTAVPLGLL